MNDKVSSVLAHEMAAVLVNKVANVTDMAN